jgi:hypothetical protein
MWLPEETTVLWAKASFLYTRFVDQGYSNAVPSPNSPEDSARTNPVKHDVINPTRTILHKAQASHFRAANVKLSETWHFGWQLCDCIARHQSCICSLWLNTVKCARQRLILEGQGEADLPTDSETKLRGLVTKMTKYVHCSCRSLSDGLEKALNDPDPRWI